MKFSGLGGRLYRGETSINIISARKKWYTLSGVFVALSIFALSIQGLALGIEFKGGSSYTVTTTSGTIEEARTAVTTAGYTGNRPALLSQPSPMRSKMR
jgi:preprotein translocase subunit SecF